MVNNYLKLVEKLYVVEGGKIHKNKNEKDITSSCGIYRYAHPNADVFKYIDQIAIAVGITKPSTQWTSTELELVNKHIDKDLELSYSVDFYKTYFKVLDLDKLHDIMIWPFANIYTNSNKIANKAMQTSCNLMMRYNPKLFNPNNLKELVVDGIIGNGSREVIYTISSVLAFLPDGDVYAVLWKMFFINACKSEYILLSTNEVSSTGTDKDIIYLKGWSNRCDALVEDKL